MIIIENRQRKYELRLSTTSSEIVSEFPYAESTPEIRVEATDEDKLKIVDDLAAFFKSQYEIIDIDGARLLFGDGWGLVRA